MNRSGGYRNRGRGSRGGGGNGRPTRTQPRGLFADGIWHCDCQPRLPAEHFRVKKEGKNQGRWFYTCQKQDRCGFFLWDDDAKPREEAAVLSGSRTEPVGAGHGQAQEGWSAGRAEERKRGGEDAGQGRGHGLFAGVGWNQKTVVNDEETASEASPPPERTATRASKRSAKEADMDGDEDFGWALGEQADALEREASLQTPLKAQKTGVYATPATTATKRKLPWLEQPATPASTKPNQTMDYFDTPSKAPSANTATDSNEPETPHAPPTTSTTTRTPSPPARHRNALINPNDSTSTLNSELLACLFPSKITLPPATMSELRSIATKHDLRAQGIAKGREISRLAIKAKDAKIAELQARIASLEAEREVERAVGRWGRGKGRSEGDGEKDRS